MNGYESNGEKLLVAMDGLKRLDLAMVRRMRRSRK
jgi:hypothetical protein